MPYHLGRGHLGLHAFGPAADAFAVAVRLDSTLADAHAYAAVALAQLGRLDDSRRHCAISTRYLETTLAGRVAEAMLCLARGIAAASSHATEERGPTSGEPLPSKAPVRRPPPGRWPASRPASGG